MSRVPVLPVVGAVLLAARSAAAVSCGAIPNCTPPAPNDPAPLASVISATCTLTPVDGVANFDLGNRDIVIKAAIEVKGSDIIVDLEGSSPQVDWGGNVVYNFTYAYVHMAVKSMFDPYIPNNDGCARPITLKIPEGTVVNCRFPAAVAARMQIGHFMTEIIYRALAKAVPNHVIAASGGTPATMTVFYGRKNDARPWHSVIISGGGMGASSMSDGNYVYIFPANGANTPIEIFESDTPLIVERRELLMDTSGPGRMKGGLGQREVFRVPSDQ